MKRKYLLCVQYLLCICTLVFSVTSVFAEGSGKITVSCPLEGMHVSIYRVGEHTTSGTFTLTDTVQQYPVSLDCTDAQQRQGTANALKAYILRDHIEASAENISLSDTRVYFTGLTNGLYLVVGNETKVNEEGKVHVYTPQVFFIDITDDEEISVVLKYYKKEISEETYRKVHVIKVWKNDILKERPDAISVDILQKDEFGNVNVYDRQILNEDNAWSYTWSELSNVFEWSVIETDVPSEYTLSSSEEGTTIVLTNTGVLDTAVQPGESTGDKLPQTGQLWWPVPVLGITGVMCLILGRVLQHKEDL